ncbi:hypothetical protein FNF29_06006 [Cafeteria roenbergensis]|uniref:Methyltransferase domain-containing protein n=1 Tax=Cafeteria roenbergensis TaxID=33653 RepID=A0A5A8C8Q7_CAFRO|nr:hypothetical protein FNF29_06006 [Cafeteria roenbergensis]|eukprot:KAA0149453.1 hypothetical protein FNF29_06006 [Cafeteria roenbergensis]
MSFDTRSAAFAYLRTYYSAAALDREDTFLLDATIDGIEHARRVAVAAGQSLRCLELGCGPVAAWALCPGAVAGELWLAERSQGGRQVLHEWLTGDREAFDWSVYAAHVAKRMVELVVMHSVADAISGTPEEFAALVSSAARLVAPRGSLLISVNTEVDEWHAEAVAFPQVRLSCDQVLAAIEGAGLQAVFSRQRSRLPDGKDTETAHTMVVLADKPPRAE